MKIKQKVPVTIEIDVQERYGDSDLNIHYCSTVYVAGEHVWDSGWLTTEESWFDPIVDEEYSLKVAQDRVRDAFRELLGGHDGT